MEGKAPKEEIESFKEYVIKRDEVIKEWFPKLQALLKKLNYKPEALVHLKTEGKIKERKGMKQVSRFYVYYRHKSGDIIRLEIDDGAKVNGKWYFTDKPTDSIIVEKDGKKESHSVE